MSVTKRHLPASTRNVCDWKGTGSASSSPSAQSPAPTTARSILFVFIAADRRGSVADALRDKLDFHQTSGLFLRGTSWSSFEPGDSYSRGSDSAVWPRETQRPPHRLHQWLFRFAASGASMVP